MKEDASLNPEEMNLISLAREYSDENKARELVEAAKDTVEIGVFIKGFVETINIHDTNRTFSIYPVIGPDKIRCIFPGSLKEKAKQAFGNFVRVHGDFKYRWRAVHPYEIAVTEIEIMESQAEIPRLRDMWGVAPDATGDIAPELFIEALRNV